MQKSKLRGPLRAARLAVDPAERARCEAAIVGAFTRWVSDMPVRAVVLYAASGGEVDLGDAAAWLASSGRAVAYPRVAGDRLVLHHATPDTLVHGYHGILEPREDAPIMPLGEVDVIAVPGLAFDPSGGRLGQGGGHYDRLLARPERRATTVGVGLGCQLLATVPREAHDVILDHVLTEDGFAR